MHCAQHHVSSCCRLAETKPLQHFAAYAMALTVGRGRTSGVRYLSTIAFTTVLWG